MKKFLFCIFSFVSFYVPAQSTFKVVLKDSITKEPAVGAIVKFIGTKMGAVTDINGAAEVPGIPDGTYKIAIGSGVYRTDTLTLPFPNRMAQPLTHFVVPLAQETEVVIITSSRTGNRIEQEPLKVEVIGSDEVDEKSSMLPGNISMMLTEYTGLQPQQTSQTSGNMNIRIQGLDGRYTQFLKDGFPLYGGFSGELSLMQTPPLDLKQVEIVKGSASTLYGGDAIAGMINLISREPDDQAKWSLIVNETTRLGTDISSFYSSKKDKNAFTLLANHSRTEAVDINNDFFTEIPQVRQLAFNPKWFHRFNDSTRLMFGMFTSWEERIGGDIKAITDEPNSFHSFFEKNTSSRTYTQLKLEKKLKHGILLTVKNSLNYFDRRIDADTNRFHGTHFSTFSEVSASGKIGSNTLVLGANAWSEDFEEDPDESGLLRNYFYTTLSMFIQDDWKLSEKFIVQPGFRYDYQNKYGFYYLPHLAVMYRPSKNFYMRLNGGRGYKVPTIFSIQSEERAYRNVLPIGKTANPETSKGGNIDFNFHCPLFKELTFNITQTFFATQIDNPLIADPDSMMKDLISFKNAGGYTRSMGSETNFVIRKDETNLIVSYTYTDAKNYFDSTFNVVLNAKHRLILDLMWDIEGKWRIGVEGFYTGQQFLTNGQGKPDYWLLGVLIVRYFPHCQLSLNFENVLNERQASHEPFLFSGTVQHPKFNEVWGPMEGISANLSLKINL